MRAFGRWLAALVLALACGGHAWADDGDKAPKEGADAKPPKEGEAKKESVETRYLEVGDPLLLDVGKDFRGNSAELEKLAQEIDRLAATFEQSDAGSKVAAQLRARAAELRALAKENPFQRALQRRHSAPDVVFVTPADAVLSSNFTVNDFHGPEAREAAMQVVERLRAEAADIEADGRRLAAEGKAADAEHRLARARMVRERAESMARMVETLGVQEGASRRALVPIERADAEEADALMARGRHLRQAAEHLRAAGRPKEADGMAREAAEIEQRAHAERQAATERAMAARRASEDALERGVRWLRERRDGAEGAQGADPANLRAEIAGLREEVRALRTELREIKEMLQAR